ncbi:hypothetical protein JKP88DRAFT_240982 [Tribonema minus]|uniref:Uncharacterized protein n=1 Tax=Tribonema minus TaxID=303371 RepID=A0A835ZA62_9STRA|nr:hypothetical protein JKP88DRAFT_240982 [Tribonema minus]
MTKAKATTGKKTCASKKTRAQLNKEENDRRDARKVPRVTDGIYTFKKAKKEAEHRGFDVSDDAEAYWNKQTCTPKTRKMLMKNGRSPDINSIVSGHTRSSPATAAERKATKDKYKHTVTEHNLGQVNWMESAATMAALKILDPHNEFTFETVPDGLGCDTAAQDTTSGLYAAIQAKSGEMRDGQTILHVSRKDGEAGGRYPTCIILGVLITNIDREAIKDSLTAFDYVPTVEVSDIFLFGSATEFPNKTLAPYPRKKADDVYGDNRYVVGFDSEERLEIMRQKFRRLLREKAVWTRSDLWFGLGSNTPNPNVGSKHQEEVKNCVALAALVGFNNLRAPNMQNETTDVVWRLDKKDVRISLKSSTVANKGKGGGFWFHLGKHPNDHFCDYVFTSYRDTRGVRMSMSVIKASRAYNDDKKHFCWSPTSNKDILESRIDLRGPDALSKLIAAVSGMDTIA